VPSGHGSRLLNQVALQCDHPVAPHHLPGVAEALHHQCIPEDIPEGGQEFGVEVHQPEGIIHNSRVIGPGGKASSLQPVERQKCGPADLRPLQVLDGSSSIAVRLRHYALHARARRHLDGGGVLCIYTGEL